MPEQGTVTTNDKKIPSGTVIDDALVPTTTNSTSTSSNGKENSSPLRGKQIQKSPTPQNRSLPVLSRADTGREQSVNSTSNSNTSTAAATTLVNMNLTAAPISVPTTMPQSATSRRYNNIEDIITPTVTETPALPTSETKQNELQVKPKRNSLRRANIPPPLGLQLQNDHTTSGASSAPEPSKNNNNKLHIPLDPQSASARRFSATTTKTGGVSKLRVRYLGKMSRYPANHNPNSTSNPNHNVPLRRLSQSGVPPAQMQAQAQLNAMLLYNQQQQQQYMATMMMMGIYPYMYNENVQMPMPPMPPMPMPMPLGHPPNQPPVPMDMNTAPRSAMLSNFPPQTYPYFRNQGTIDSSSSSLLSKGYQGIDNTLHNHQIQQQQNQIQQQIQQQQQQQQHQYQHQASAQPPHLEQNSSPHKEHFDQGDVENDEEEEDDEEEEEEEADLAIESDALPTPIFTRRPTPPEMMQGEIRIMQNKFSFEFPVTNPAIDRKMFLSICNKIWTESRELEKDI
ncbi:similar to Saccharomyces cerevisiae YDR480W DIG2 MAP kinase- responsive inhibitor of the Ste12p transcription factor [Maudiozyma barnettii]|uniref:Similar to Saccharomyces cerevisiae YDR480W DIG2 MAP kinase- responsive inhibitor of the Ste12p transcription factor n=1 Tax=Maudiozyma barnettii TaxID=61262 RepID=A0A8H2VHM0_9SACH|nr:uncharacterized protein KABA2_07S05412 [Kazachstania barnettii]CAB4255829.1 similar to Saccharomyces cerevisiae YDR480W DIG2 MAP kinase- responsive inhibitor of the Ste12p transcription factor [Kazachstania barnettii]CAD1784390.1 similar to Saccharomyces cerevisiae YDR480W DIG2 MAP kinase- responsive inhibitor of the Ste12p transcription factor [Kazachstania barnettii]